MRRRDFIKSALILAGARLSIPAARPSPGSAQPARALKFDYGWLKNHARRLGCSDYKAAERLLPNTLTQLDYDAYQAIRFAAGNALWRREGLGFRVEFFHRGPMFKEPVRMHEVVDGQASAIAYDPAMFDLKPTDDSTEPIDLRLYLRQGRQALTETWLYQWTPPPVTERHL